MGLVNCGYRWETRGSRGDQSAGQRESQVATLHPTCRWAHSVSEGESVGNTEASQKNEVRVT